MFSAFDDELPLQLYQLGTDRVQCFRSLPSDYLVPYIHYYWWLSIAPGNTTLDIIPDNAIDLVMSPDISDFSVLYLPAPQKFSIPLHGPINYVGISFRAASASNFFGVCSNILNDCAPGVDTTESLRIEAIVDGVQRLTHPEELAESLDALVSQRLENQTLARPVIKLDIDKALAAMQASVGPGRMDAVATHFGLSDRQFRRILGSLFGYGPKKIQRVMRLQASLKEILTADPNTMEDGFYDQAHRIKEVRALTGLTPGEIKKMSEIYNSMD